MRTDHSETNTAQDETPRSAQFAHADRRERVLRARRGWTGFGVRDLWNYRELLFFFSWRNVKVRYKQTIIGGGWAILQPFFMMIAFTLLFGRVANISTDGIPRPIFYYAALLPWTYFTTTVSTASESVAQSQSLITKVFFPRVMLPISYALSSLMDHAIAFVMLLVLMVYYGVSPTTSLLVLPALIGLSVLTATGVSLWTSSLNAMYRDVRYAVPFLLQFGMFVSPVIYPTSQVPGRWRMFYLLNPMASVIDGYRWALTGIGERPGLSFLVSCAVAIFILLTGAWFFRRIEGIIADVV